MPRVVDYAQVLEQARQSNLLSAYYNSGSFKFPNGDSVQIVGWLGPDDPTIRPDLPAQLVRVDVPYEKHLTDKLINAWQRIAAPAWVMPKSHWAFELDHGNGRWMAPALSAIGIDPETLRHRTDGSAVAFLPGEAGLAGLVQTLLMNLVSSDFAILFPGQRHLVTIHHHKQLWWQTPDAHFAGTLVP
ncbi:MAG: hypothetical protein ACTHLZ_03460 [Tepidisphaeraceae bacterium]